VKVVKISNALEARNHAIQEARAHLDAILELVTAIECARANGYSTFDGEEMSLDELEERAQEWPLSVLVRSGWISPGGEMRASEYEVLLCTGGPAVRIRGDLSEHCEPETLRLECQDWFISWDQVSINSGEAEALLRFVGLFYFGE